MHPVGRLALAIALLAPRPALALFQNGTFENATAAAGWTVEYATYGGNFTFNWSSDGTNHPQPYNVVLGQPAISPTSLVVTPYEGQQTLAINDIEFLHNGSRGGCDATRISQTDNITQADLDAGCLHISYGALLEYASDHTSAQEPYFEIDLVVGGNVVSTFKATSIDAVQPNSGWTSVGNNFWYRRGDVTFDLRSYPVGTSVTLTMLVTDCSLGAHAGMAFLDNVRVEPCTCTPPQSSTICSDACAMRAPITHSVYPNGMDGTTNPFLIYIYNATDVDFYVFNRWDGGTAYEYHTHDVNGLKDAGQDYFTLKYYGAKSGGGALIPSDQYDIKIHMANCGDDQTLGPSPLTVLSAVAQEYPSVHNDNFTGPTISVQPPYLSLTSGSTATFTVAATGAGPLTYRWRKDGYPLFDGPSLGGGTISGAYTSTLTITPANQADAGVYDVVVTNACCVSDTSAAGGLCFPALSITSQPQDLVVPLGGTATFAVTASDPNSATPLIYGWCRADLAFCYSQQTTPTYTIPSVGPSDYGKYFVQVSSQCGSVVSRIATLRPPDNGAVNACWDSRFAGAGGLDGHGQVLAVDGQHNLYVGGSFGVAGGTSAARVARWNGEVFTALGTGMDGPVYALAVDAAGNLYAGGAFTTAGGVGASNVAKWNGSSWSALGSGTNATVYALAVDGAGNVYAGGSFTSAGGTGANSIAEWNGTGWGALGTGMGTDGVIAPAVSAIKVDDVHHLVYAGGTFGTSGGVTTHYIAAWNGSSWSALGTGTNGYVYGLALDGSGDVYACGGYTIAGGASANNVAEWNGSSWVALGTGLTSSTGVAGVALDAGGNLYVGGQITAAGGNSAQNLAVWNGSTWSALGAGANAPVQSLVVDSDGDLYASGQFTSAGGRASNYIAHLIPGCLQLVTATGVPQIAPQSARLFDLLPAVPNPTAGSTNVRFVLPMAGQVSAEVLDVSGRRIASLAHGQWFAAGAHELTWDGRTANGALASPGVYMIRVGTPGHCGVVRVIMIR